MCRVIWCFVEHATLSLSKIVNSAGLSLNHFLSYLEDINCAYFLIYCSLCIYLSIHSFIQKLQSKNNSKPKKYKMTTRFQVQSGISGSNTHARWFWYRWSSYGTLRKTELAMFFLFLFLIIHAIIRFPDISLLFWFMRHLKFKDTL